MGRQRARPLANATALPGSIPTNGGHSEISGVSCATGNYCVAVGETATSQFADRATVDVDLGGTWQQAMLVPGLDTSELGGAVGVVSFRGQLHRGRLVPGRIQREAAVRRGRGERHLGLLPDLGNFSQLNTGQFAQLNSVSCESPRNCTAAGEYATLGGTPHAFLVAEVSGTWHLPGPLLFVLPPSTGHAVSCPVSGNCALTGTAADVNGQIQATSRGRTRAVRKQSSS